jgi:hypothetical protein
LTDPFPIISKKYDEYYGDAIKKLKTSLTGKNYDTEVFEEFTKVFKQMFMVIVDSG